MTETGGYNALRNPQEAEPTTTCKHCGRPIVDQAGIWRHFVSGIAPCSFGRQIWAEPADPPPTRCVECSAELRGLARLSTLCEVCHDAL